MSASERRKGIRGEREVVALLRAYGLAAARTPNSGGLALKGDLSGVPGYHFEVKRAETLRVPAWLRQAHADAEPGATPVVAFRTTSRAGEPTGEWQAVIALADLARLLALAESRRAERQRV